MKFFDLFIRRESLTKTPDEIARDIAFDDFLRKRHEAREREKAKAMKKEKEISNHDKKTGNR